MFEESEDNMNWLHRGEKCAGNGQNSNPSRSDLEQNSNPSRRDLVQNSNSLFKTKIYRLFRPFLICMSVFGVYFHRLEYKPRRCRYSLTQIYSTLILVLICLIFVRIFTDYDYHKVVFDSELIFRLLNHSFIFLCVIHAVTAYRGCYKVSLTRKMFQQWHVILENPNFVFIYGYQLKITVVVTIVFIFVFLFSGVTFTCVWISSPSHVSKLLEAVIDLGTVSKIAVRTLDILSDVYLQAMWLWTLGLVFLTSVTICLTMKSFNQSFSKAISKDGVFTGDFEEYRQTHQQICRLVEIADDTLSLFYGAGLIANLVQCLLLLYVLIWQQSLKSTPVVLGVFIYWKLLSIISLLFYCISGAAVNHYAHSPLSEVYDLDMKKNKGIVTEVQMFLSRLTAESIGLTAGKMFVIDKTSLLTVCGVFVTYFLVLVQFQSTASTCSTSQCNMTEYTGNSTLHCYLE